jgi:heat shock transcription factor
MPPPTTISQAPPPPIAVCFDEPTVPAFLLKLYTMLEDPNTDDIIGWSQTGDSFVVYQPAEFSQLVFP